MHTVLLIPHVAAGIAGLLLGPLLARDLSAPPYASAYLAAVSLLAATALGLVALDVAGLWFLAPLALGTVAAAAGGLRARGMPTRVRGVGGSYVALITALLVVSWGSPLAWILPTAIGAPLIERAAARA